MSATETVGAYIIGTRVDYDADEKLHSVKMGIKTKKGMILNYTVHGITPESAVNKAKQLARILTATRPVTIKHPWVKFDGNYEKEYYDVKLITGEIVESCYPNAGTFHVLEENNNYAQGAIIEGVVVAEIRLSLYDPFKKRIHE